MSNGDPPRCIDEGPDVFATAERMNEIIERISGTQHPDPRIEYSAHLCLSALTMAVANGMTSTRANCQRVMRMIAQQVIPAIEAEVKRMTTDNGQRTTDH